MWSKFFVLLGFNMFHAFQYIKIWYRWPYSPLKCATMFGAEDLFQILGSLEITEMYSNMFYLSYMDKEVKELRVFLTLTQISILLSVSIL